jgi:hypothetical protein
MQPRGDCFRCPIVMHAAPSHQAIAVCSVGVSMSTISSRYFLLPHTGGRRGGSRLEEPATRPLLADGSTWERDHAQRARLIRAQQVARCRTANPLVLLWAHPVPRTCFFVRAGAFLWNDEIRAADAISTRPILVKVAKKLCFFKHKARCEVVSPPVSHIGSGRMRDHHGSSEASVGLS